MALVVTQVCLVTIAGTKALAHIRPVSLQHGQQEFGYWTLVVAEGFLVLLLCSQCDW